MPRHPLLAAPLAGLLAGLALCASVAPSRAVEVLTGTLKGIAETGTVRLGYRESSLPFSFADGAGRPAGYALDLCLEVVDDLAKELGRSDLKVRYEPVTSENRIEAVTSGRIDLECGSTTANAERRRVVAFSPVTYFSATKLLVKRGAPIGSYRDLAGRTVAVTAGTTNEAVLRALFARLKIPATIVTGQDHAQSFALVRDGKADALGLDDVLLYGLIAGAGQDGAAYTVLQDKLSFEPYGLMFRKDDPQFAGLVTATFQRLAESRELRWIYERWFLKRLPSGLRLNVPMSDELHTNFQVIGLQD
ncbi:amino acid ABC transporter substrate-binding protein [Methylobacterium sp. J-078]|uniref:amino acid ABC transporter substrate-binding protein n=1 Tax=Methylobacterium sp. J-078 TaxID=2836657 RepID=UPI001FBAA57D|nr:amino acid ABC transporter substrate-binding protein [Methylobacterium sp. J-078]MCJ2047835.1 amino acid ABC transporter substrate-binding protein [Methylobacterium sp. J-078]